MTLAAAHRAATDFPNWDMYSVSLAAAVYCKIRAAARTVAAFGPPLTSRFPVHGPAQRGLASAFSSNSRRPSTAACATMSPKPAHEPRVAASGTGLDWSTLPISLPPGSFSTQLSSSWPLRSSIGVSLTWPVTEKVSAPGESITTILLEPSARRMPPKSWRLPSDGAPLTGATMTLTWRGLGGRAWLLAGGAAAAEGPAAAAVCIGGPAAGGRMLAPGANWP